MGLPIRYVQAGCPPLQLNGACAAPVPADVPDPVDRATPAYTQAHADLVARLVAVGTPAFPTEDLIKALWFKKRARDGRAVRNMEVWGFCYMQVAHLNIGLAESVDDADSADPESLSG